MDFEEHLRKKYENCQSTIHNNLKVLRMLFNKAINEGFEIEDGKYRKYHKMYAQTHC
jgi:hypothetical protein